MEIGEPWDDWATLADASTLHPRPRPMPVRLKSSEEISTDRSKAGFAAWAARIDHSLRRTATRDLVIYAHGAKVGFHHSCAFVAELDHFAGRDLTHDPLDLFDGDRPGGPHGFIEDEPLAEFGDRDVLARREQGIADLVHGFAAELSPRCAG